MFAEFLQRGGLSFDRLQSFCLVAQAGGLTKAAKGDPARQSLFSRQIKELEEFFGAELIRRKGRGIALTEAGTRLDVIARECFASLSDFKSECQNRPVEVVIGTGESVIQWLLMPRLDSIGARTTNLRLRLLNLSTSEAVKRLADGMIDFGVVRKDAISRSLQSKSLGTMAYSLFIPGRLQTSGTPTDGLKRLDGVPLATLEGEGSFRSELSRAAKKEKVKLNIQVECSSFTLAATAVAKGQVAAILPSIASADLQAANVNQYGATSLRTFDREMCLAWNPRLLRIRPVLQRMATVLADLCRF